MAEMANNPDLDPNPLLPEPDPLLPVAEISLVLTSLPGVDPPVPLIPSVPAISGSLMSAQVQDRSVSETPALLGPSASVQAKPQFFGLLSLAPLSVI